MANSLLITPAFYCWWIKKGQFQLPLADIWLFKGVGPDQPTGSSCLCHLSRGQCLRYDHCFRWSLDVQRVLSGRSESLSESLDPTFMDSNSDSDIPALWSRNCADVEEAFENLGFARLQTTTSDDALAAVWKHPRPLTLFASAIFTSSHPECKISCCFCRTALKLLSRIDISLSVCQWLWPCWMVFVTIFKSVENYTQWKKYSGGIMWNYKHCYHLLLVV